VKLSSAAASSSPRVEVSFALERISRQGSPSQFNGPVARLTDEMNAVLAK